MSGDSTGAVGRDPGPITAPVVPGYRLGDLLGAGAVGTVWSATREADDAPVAIKVVPVGAGEQAESAARELSVLARVDVEGLVGFHEALGLTGEPQMVALVLDRVGGGSLDRTIRARGHLSVGESVTILAPVARTLAGLHALGVSHGDVTPGNVLLERTGRPLLADLGVAALVGEVPGDVYGTAGFVAPEVAERGVVTPAADVYAVGALAWSCVTGGAPEPVALRHPLEELAPGLPAAWREATMRALAGDPTERPSAAELALAYFDSAPCEPLRLVVGSDETSLLTQRLRQSSAPSADTGTAEGGERAGRAAAFWAGARGSARRASRAVASSPARALWAVPRPAVRTFGPFATAAVLLLALLGGGLVASGRLPMPGWASRDSTTGSSPGDTVQPVSAPQDAGSDATDHAAPKRDPRALMQELSTVRARAMVSGSAAELRILDAPGWEALAQDTRALQVLADSHRRYSGVTLTVRSAELVARSGTRPAETATVDAVVDTSAYQVVDSAGSSVVAPAVAGERLRFTLVWSGGRWLVGSIARSDPSAR